MLRWQVLFHKALTPFLVSAYAAVAGVIGVACGYFADNLSAHLRPASAKAPIEQERKASRVEVWLKAQTVVFEKPVAAQAETEDPVAVLPEAAFQQPVRHAAEMAAALDGSEAVSIPSTDSIVTAEESPQPPANVQPFDNLAIAEIREPAVSLKPVEVVTPVEIVKPVEGLNPTQLNPTELNATELNLTQAIVAVEAASLERVAKLQAAKRPGRVVVMKVKDPVGDKSKLAAVKLRKMPKALASAKAEPAGRFGTAVIRARFADTPSEIIRRSLMGTG